MKRVCVIGGGAAGMMAAYAAAQAGCSVTLLEKNEKLGKKIYITGKGRCNITNSADISEFFDSVVTNNTFLYSAFYTFSNTDLISFLEKFGLKTKIERGGRVFPVSDKASDVIKAFEKALRSSGVEVRLNTTVKQILAYDGRVSQVVSDKAEDYDSVIIASGGVSYPSTGSTGDGYFFAKSLGHSVSKPSATLVGLDIAEDVSSLAGLTLKNVNLLITAGKKQVFSQQGEMLFTHGGISGPLVLSASAYMDEGTDYEASIDLKPALSEKMLDGRLVRDFTERANQNFSNVLGGLVPKALIDFVISQSGISANEKANSITKEQRRELLWVLKGLKLKLKGKRPVAEAVVTRGGVSVKQIHPSTMQSRLIEGLYFAGEVIDVDALTGGFNLQIAFSTGYLAGTSQQL